MKHKPASSARPPSRDSAANGAAWRLWVVSGLSLALATVLAAYLLIAGRAPRTGGDVDELPTDRPAMSTAPSPGPAPAGMVWIPAGTFHMGSDDPSFPDAAPVHLVTLDGFWMDKTEVTNEQFAEFVKATGYVTVAEQQPDPREFPGVPPAELKPFSLVFVPPAQVVSLRNHDQWWRPTFGASWKHPEGPDSDIRGREKHPVVHVCWTDAAAYAKWAGKRLPTEAEWEYAARGGLDRKKYAWGEDLKPGDKWQANIWQGRFPMENTAEDGFPSLAPVASFAPNGFGLYDMAGNVWEWCADWYRPDYYAESPRHNPLGPDDSLDPLEPQTPKRVQRGGSFLCSDVYCVRYQMGSRGKGDVNSAYSHVGFRCVKSAR